MRKKYKKIAITLFLAFGLFINLSSNIQDEVNNPSITISSDPIIGDH